MSIAAKIEQINSTMDEAVEEQQAGNYSGAREKVETAFILITGLPQRALLENEELQWNADGIKTLLDYLTSRVTASSGSILQSAPVRYER